MPASADSPPKKLNHDAIAMARFFSGLLDRHPEKKDGYRAVIFLIAKRDF